MSFENDVKMYGIQTYSSDVTGTALFENDVKMYGIQTNTMCNPCIVSFENDVKMYGIQTFLKWFEMIFSLRMM